MKRRRAAASHTSSALLDVGEHTSESADDVLAPADDVDVLAAAAVAAAVLNMY